MGVRVVVPRNGTRLAAMSVPPPDLIDNMDNPLNHLSAFQAYCYGLRICYNELPGPAGEWYDEIVSEAKAGLRDWLDSDGWKNYMVCGQHNGLPITPRNATEKSIDRSLRKAHGLAAQWRLSREIDSPNSDDDIYKHAYIKPLFKGKFWDYDAFQWARDQKGLINPPREDIGCTSMPCFRFVNYNKWIMRNI